MADCHFKEFRASDIDLAGMNEILKSQEVANILNEAAESYAFRANNIGKTHADTMRIKNHVADEEDEPLYKSLKSKRGSFTALAYVVPASKSGAYDNNKHHTLNALNH